MKAEYWFNLETRKVWKRNQTLAWLESTGSKFLGIGHLDVNCIDIGMLV